MAPKLPHKGNSKSSTSTNTSTSSSGGWLSTKKRGRDDAEIAASRKKALMDRQNRTGKHSMGGGGGRSGGKQPALTKNTKKKRRNDDSSTSSPSSSMEDFIVDSDDDVEDEEDFVAVDSGSSSSRSSHDEDDSEVLHVRPPVRPRPASTHHHRMSATVQVDSDDDDSVDSDTFLPQKPPLQSRPGKLLLLTNQQQRRQPVVSTSMSSSRPKASTWNTTTSTTTRPHNKYKDKEEILDESSNDDASNVLAVGRSVGTATRGQQHPRDSLASLSSSDGGTRTHHHHHKTAKENNIISLLDVETPPSVHKDIHKRPAAATSLLRQPTQQSRPNNNPFASFALTSKNSFLEDTDDDDDKEDHNDDDSHDEQVAIQLAIKKSLKDSKKIVLTKKTTKKTTAKRTFVTKKHQPPPSRNPPTAQPISNQWTSKSKALVMDVDDDEEEEPLATEELLNDSSSSSSNEDEDDDDDAVDSHEQKVAMSVLETAASLSAQVVATMNQWATASTTTTTDTNDLERETEPSHGLIVNGALALGSISTATLPSNSKWISEDTMQQACPGVTLSKYQLVGVNWLALLHGMKCTLNQQGGKEDTPVNGVLADEMGLGKTVQTIAFLAWLKHQRRDQQSITNYHPPHIIVVPVSVLPNWMREFETFAPHMKVIKYHGSMAEREVLQDELQEHFPGRRRYPQQRLDALLVPVTYYQKESSDDRRFLNKFRFEYLVVDEAHMLKNSLSTRYKMLNKLKTNHRLLLTGTPVQNSPQELLNMLCFIMPLFSKGSKSLDHDDGDGDNGTSVGDRMLQHFVDAEQQKSGDEQVAYAKLKQLFAPFVLRRKKADVIAQLLPPKKKVIEYVELEDAGRKIYNSILEDHINKSGTKSTTPTAAIGEHLFTNLRKAAHHPLLLRTRHNTPAEVDHLVTFFHKYQAFAGEGSTKVKVAEELTKYNDFQIHLTALDLVEENPHRRPDLERYILDESALFSSAKFSRLRTMLPDLIETQGHRVLIFSGWTSCLDLLGCLMEQLGFKYLRMDGSCPSDIRQARIDEFNTNASIPVFLLSTRACGLGINLTAADTCIMHDLDFNPFNDLQAEDRCHRIGQTKPVTVYKFVSKDTVDADIYEMQERKAKMNAAIMESSSSTASKSAEVGKQERKAILQSVMQKFLSPDGKTKPRLVETLVL